MVALCDNSSAVANLQSGYGNKLPANELMFDLFSDLHRKGIELTVEHVPGKLNPADDPSRINDRGCLKQCNDHYGTELVWSNSEGDWEVPFLDDVLDRVNRYGDPTGTTVGKERPAKRPAAPSRH